MPTQPRSNRSIRIQQNTSHTRLNLQAIHQKNGETTAERSRRSSLRSGAGITDDDGTRFLAVKADSNFPARSRNYSPRISRSKAEQITIHHPGETKHGSSKQALPIAAYYTGTRARSRNAEGRSPPNSSPGSGPSAPLPRPANGGSQNTADSSTATPSTSAATHCSLTTRVAPQQQQPWRRPLPPLPPAPPPPPPPAPSGGCCCASPASFPIRRRDLTHLGRRARPRTRRRREGPPLPPQWVLVVALRVRVAGRLGARCLRRRRRREVGEEGERKGEVNRSEVKWKQGRDRPEMKNYSSCSRREAAAVGGD